MVLTTRTAIVNADAAVARAIGANVPGNYTYDWRNYTGGNWGNNAVNAPEAWARGYTGKDITVAVIDSGVDINHSDLNDNIWRNVSEIVGNGIDDDGNGYIDDINGWNTGLNNNNILPIDTHGTHVAGTIAGENNGTGVTGVAYNSDIMAIRVFDNATDANVAQGIRYAVDNGARVINMSLGGYFYTPEILDALAYAASRNVIAVIAAGNESQSQPSYPARFATEYGISVGAININGNITYFSNRAGNNPDILHVVAPGQDIKSTIPGNSYASYPGTSMAAPHVAGVVALMLDANPHLSHTQVRQIIAETAARMN
jgi:subtilisin family serine protease